MLSFVYVALIIGSFAIACFLIRRADKLWSQSYNPFVLISAVTILYTIVPWVGSLGQGDLLINDFLLLQLIAILGMSCGAVYAQVRHPPRSQPSGIAVIPRFGANSIVVAEVVGIAAFLICYEYFFGGLLNIILFGYREITSAETNAGVLKFIILVLVQYGIPAVLLAAYMTGVNRRLFYAVTAIYVLLMLASGTRNFLIMFAGNFMLFSSVFRRRLSYFALTIFSVVGLVFLLIVGVYRNFGFEARSDLYGLYAAEGVRLINPNSQELGTSYSVFRISSSDPTWYDWGPGESYWNALLSIVPTFLWETRPDSVSRKFSTYFAVPGEGLGFSNILEAYLNGGYIFVFVNSFVLMHLAIFLYNRLVVERVTAIGLAFYGNLVFVAFNWNRIDFQTVFKISIIRIALFYLIAVLLLKIVNVSSISPKPARGRLFKKIRSRLQSDIR